MEKQALARAKIIISMFIYGSLPLFIRNIALPSPVIANARAIIGSVFIILLMLVLRKNVDWASVRRNALPLLLSGIMLGFNWMLLFESYNYTTVAISTLCYYMAPLILVAVSPVLFKESLTLRKLLCLAAALAGMVFVSGVAGGSLPSSQDSRGILLGLSAAVFYAAIVTCNKKLTGISGLERTLIQLAISALVMLPYNFLTIGAALSVPDTLSLIMLLTVGIVHTGIAYALYFGSMGELPSQTLAILSYIDPVVAVLLSAIVLHEPMSLGMWLGSALIIGAALVLDLPGKKRD